jgi:FG-GAP-like repeat
MPHTESLCVRRPARGRLAVAGRLAATVLVSSALTACAREAEPTRGPLRWDRTVLLEDSAATSANVSAADLDGDGHTDLVLVKGRHWPLMNLVLRGDGQGGFEEPYAAGPQADRSYTGALADLDRDGDLDLVVSNDRPDPKVVLLNDGTGHFGLGSTFGEPEWSTRHLSIADFDGDGVPDVVLANRYGDDTGPSFVCFGDSEGGFNEPCAAVVQGSATTITPADINGDGAPDLVYPYRDGGQSYVYLDDGSAGFGERRPFGPPDAAIRGAEVADFNADGVLDIAFIDTRTGPGIFFGAGDGSYGEPLPLGDADARPYAIEVDDLDQDGSPDIIIGYVGHHPIAYLNDGASAFAAVPFGDDEGVAYGFAVADFDEDGVMDIAVARSDAPNVLYFGSE